MPSLSKFEVRTGDFANFFDLCGDGWGGICADDDLFFFFLPGAKFDVVHDTLDDLRAGKISEIPAYGALRDVLPKEMLLEMMAALGVAMVTGVFDLEGDALNDKYRNRIQPVKMRDFIQMHWEGR